MFGAVPFGGMAFASLLMPPPGDVPPEPSTGAALRRIIRL